MASPNDYVNNRGHTVMFGIPLDRDKPQESLKVTPDSTAWDVYNYHAGRAESEIVKDWNSTLNTLLVFAGLYSAVLTAFITESMKLIQEDSSDSTRDILLHISRQLAVTSTPAFDQPPFVPPEWALRVNYCFFFSISCALITALAAVLALQWVGSYDRGLNPSSMESRALQRQFRMEGAERWKLEYIISSLPSIIFISLLLFGVGLAEWLWNIHHNVAVIVIVGASIGTLFYIVTTIASMLSVVAPFRTPASRYIPLWLGFILKSITTLFERTRPKSTTVNTIVESIGAMVTAIHTDARIHVPERTGVVLQTHRPPRWRLFLRRILKPITPFYSIESFEAREQKAVAANKDIKLASLFWVARSISIEPCHRLTLMLIMEAILNQPKRELQHDHTNGNLWKLIFTELYVPFKGKTNWADYSSEDLKNASLFVRGVSSIGQGLLDDIEFRDLVLSFYGNYTGHLVMYQTMKQWKQLDLESERRASSLKDTREGERESGDSQDNSDPNQPPQEEVLGTVPHRAIEFPPGENTGLGARPLDEYPRLCQQVILTSLNVALSFRDYFPLEFIIATLQRVKRDPKKLALITTEEMFGLITKYLHIERDDIAGAHPLPFPVLDLVQETITTRLSERVVPSLDPVAYSDAVTKYLKETNNKEAHQSAILAHEAIIEQAISNLVQINALKAVNSPRVQEILIKLDQLAQCNFGLSKHSVILALSSMLDTKIDIWSQSNRVYTAKSLLSFLKVEDSNFNGENWTVWWTEVLLAFGKFANEDETTDLIVIKHGQRALSAHLPNQGKFSEDQVTRLSDISHLGVRLFAVAVTQSAALANSVLSIASTQNPKGIWTPNDAWMEFIGICFRQLNAQTSGNEKIMRAFAVGSSLNLYDQIYMKDISHRIKSPPDLFKYLSYPVLPVVLRHAADRVQSTMRLLDTMAKDEKFSAEFLKAKGFAWMPMFVGKRPAYFQRVISVMYQAISKCQEYSSAILWIKAMLKCQAAAMSVIDNGDNQITASRLWRYIFENANILMEHLKARRDTGMIPPVGHDTTSKDAQEQPPTADLVRGAIYIAKESGLAVLEDDAKPKSNSMAPREWSAHDRENWGDLVDGVIAGFEDIRARIEAPTSLDEAIALPINDVSLLRKLTLTGRDEHYFYIYFIMHSNITPSASMSAEYFHAPVLNKVIRMARKGDLSVIATLRDISRYMWFTQEFIDAEGPQLLPLRLVPESLEGAIQMITNVLELVTTYSEILVWLRVVYSCLNSVGVTLQGSDHRRAGMLGYGETRIFRPWRIGYTSRSLDSLSTLFRDMKLKWRRDRQYEPIDMVSGEHYASKGDVKSDVRSWSPDEWKNVQDIVDELLDGGLKRGYIMPAPSAEHHRFIRDPDGLCLSFRPQRVRITSTRMNLKKLPRDPDGICSSALTFHG